eukprot:12884370-Prorocentrum_lima.AAC.1
MAERGRRAALELGVSRTRSCTPRSQDVSLEADSGSGSGSVPASQAEHKNSDYRSTRNIQI